ncbi:hypothetical protein IWQ60_005231 [Tieghemiomyces parasiticus]|uniref:F-box domain-containing protein n=1 Tax=Tieghemiomyces parasiticus TaxID=78921 RepID=A0A9W8DYF0_9FUNG|nr:hypothetical protein IWQ60_005231 [Tieghemiomyces parasiticus]
MHLVTVLSLFVFVATDGSSVVGSGDAGSTAPSQLLGLPAEVHMNIAARLNYDDHYGYAGASRYTRMMAANEPSFAEAMTRYNHYSALIANLRGLIHLRTHDLAAVEPRYDYPAIYNSLSQVLRTVVITNLGDLCDSQLKQPSRGSRYNLHRHPPACAHYNKVSHHTRFVDMTAMSAIGRYELFPYYALIQWGDTTEIVDMYNRLNELRHRPEFAAAYQEDSYWNTGLRQDLEDYGVNWDMLIYMFTECWLPTWLVFTLTAAGKGAALDQFLSVTAASSSVIPAHLALAYVLQLEHGATLDDVAGMPRAADLDRHQLYNCALIGGFGLAASVLRKDLEVRADRNESLHRPCIVPLYNKHYFGMNGSHRLRVKFFVN